ncbi:MAG: ComEC/Rec2 family competence protein, partial [Thermoguttaceae bacterium]|nr:ComEC/Rec2 family competence protein [Thermoguttaceae bacterium]
MPSRDNKKRCVSAPAVPYFIAVAFGIWADACFSPDGLFWAALAVLAASASFALFLGDRRRRRRESNGDFGEIAFAANEPNGEGGESAAFGRFSESGKTEKLEERVEPNASAFWDAWLERADDEKPDNRSENGGVAAESQDWNDALRRFLTEKRRRGASLVGAARFENGGEDVGIEGIGKAGKKERGESERLLFDFEGFDEFSVWDGAAFSGVERTDDEKPTCDSAAWRAKLRTNAAQVGRLGRDRALAWARTLPWRIVWAAVAVAALAGWRHDAYFNVFSEREIAFFVPEGGGTPATLELQTTSTPVLYARDEATGARFGESETTAFEARVLRAKNGGVWEEFDGRIAVSVDGDATFLQIGDAIRVSGKLSRPAKIGNPGEYDRRYSLRARRILTRLAVGGPSDVELLPESEPRSWAIQVARALESVRLRAARTLTDELSPKNAAVASGMTFGFRNGIDDETNETFRATGTIHLLSISGLHVSLVAAAFCVLLRWTGVSARWVSVATVGFVLVYLGLTDMRTPVLRATLLIAILCGGVILRRRVVSLNALATAAIALLFWNPCELFQLGAQLSFLATGVFLWSSRGNVRDKGESATARLAAVRERRRTLTTAAKSGESADGAEFDENAHREENKGRARRRRALKSAARRSRRAVFGKFWALTKVGAAIWGVGTPLILNATNLLTPVAILANPIVWGPATVALLSALALAAFGTLRSFGGDLAAATGFGF